ncbi:MAG: methyltransferase domain-containing protein [Ferruginibacter sp.]
MKIKIPHLKQWQGHFHKKRGLEIGGPSAVFNPSGYLPIYDIVNGLDGVNFSTTTIWEGDLNEGKNFTFHNRTGFQYIAEGSFLPAIKNNTYDFILSCNNLEHIANPIAAIFEWKRIIKNEGAMLIILPNKKSNFDHRRPYTNFGHVVSDYEANVGEEDLTHLQEILELHDLKRDPLARPFNKFKERCSNNFTNRCLHHHVFDETLIKKMLAYCHLQIRLFHKGDTCYYVLAVKQDQ